MPGLLLGRQSGWFGEAIVSVGELLRVEERT